MTSVFPLAHEDFSFAVDLIAQGRIDVSPLFRSAWYGLGDANTAFADTTARREHVLKVIIDLTK